MKAKKEKLMNIIKSDFAKPRAIVIEINSFHGECVMGYVKYLRELGYVVDVLLNEAIAKENPFNNMTGDNIGIRYLSADKIISELKNGLASAYDVCLFNSNFYAKYNLLATDIIDDNVSNTKILTVEHSQNRICDQILKKANIIGIKKFDNNPVFQVNPHYFGIKSHHKKHRKTRFVVAGNIESKRKNHSLLKNAISDLIADGYTNFHVTVIGRGDLGEIPNNIAKHITITGRLGYDEMYKIISDSDFFLTLLDPENPDHDRYITTGTSGSFQLIYGLNIPCVIERKFATTYSLSDDISIIYRGNENFVDALKTAIDMSRPMHKWMRIKLGKFARKIYNTSLWNLKCAIDSDYCVNGKNIAVKCKNTPYWKIALWATFHKSRRIFKKSNV